MANDSYFRFDDDDNEMKYLISILDVQYFHIRLHNHDNEARKSKNEFDNQAMIFSIICAPHNIAQ